MAAKCYARRGCGRGRARANQDLLFRRREIMVKDMSAVELAIEKIKALPEAKAKALLDWLAQWEQPRKFAVSVHGTAAVRGFARRFQAQPLTTDEWMKILREGEK